VEVGLECIEIQHRSFVLSCAIFRKGSDEVIGDGTCTIAWLDYASGKAVEIPTALRERLAKG
jgi:acyl-CoA thioesterase FadM